MSCTTTATHKRHRISANPCVSPDFCLDWPALKAQFEAGAARTWPSMVTYEASRLAIAAGQVVLMEDKRPATAPGLLSAAMKTFCRQVFTSVANVSLSGQLCQLAETKKPHLRLYPASTIFPTASEKLATTRSASARASPPCIGRASIGQCRTWPGPDGNQNSIPRESFLTSMPCLMTTWRPARSIHWRRCARRSPRPISRRHEPRLHPDQTQIRFP